MSTDTKPVLIPAAEARAVSPNFITEVIDDDIMSGKIAEVVTRFPPEPNGYAHIGHAYAALLDYGVARDYGGRFHLRLDDTNPEGERQEYADALINDMKWLGLEWGDHLYYASDYYDALYDMAVRLIKEDKAYVDSLSAEEISDYRGTVTEPGRPSPYRERSVAENLELFEGMKNGNFAEGEHVLRAKIDLAAGNMKLRDPILYRILHQSHYRTGDSWHIYPMYDFAHCLSDALEGVTHSMCSLEFIENRAIYDWLVANLFAEPRPHQYEFGRRSLEYTVVSKRKLIRLVKEGYVSGWTDPRMPTLAGMRRRGITPEAIRDFVGRIGVSRTNRTIDIALLEYSVRDDLNSKAPRVMAVLDPLKVTLSNYPEGETESLSAPYWPSDVEQPDGSATTRPLTFSRELFIEREDFMEMPVKGFRRLSPGEHVWLRHAYIIRCDEVIKDDAGEVSELRCTYLPNSRGERPEGVKVKGAIHWVEAHTAVRAEFRLYDRLFKVPNPDEGEADFVTHINPESLLLKQGLVEPSVMTDPPGTRYQFERQGYFWLEPEDSSPEKLVFNRIVTLKDNWASQKQVATSKNPEEPIKVATQAGEEPDPTLSFSDEQKAKLEQLVSMGVSQDDAVILAADAKLARFLEDAAQTHANARSIANWLVNDVRRDMETADPADLPFSAADLGNLVELIDEGVINGRIATEVFADMLATGKAPAEIVKQKGLEQLTDERTIEPVVARILAANPDKVSAYQGGKTGLMGFFVGQVMKETGGKANPQLVQALLRKKLS